MNIVDTGGVLVLGDGTGDGVCDSDSGSGLDSNWILVLISDWDSGVDSALISDGDKTGNKVVSVLMLALV